MKKWHILFLALGMALALAGCGKVMEALSGAEAPTAAAQQPPASDAPAGTQSGTQAAEFENKIDLSLDKTHYDQAERIEVTMNFEDVDQDNAVIVIVNADLPHGQRTPAEEDTEEYRWIADFSEIPFYLWAPEKDGLFDARVYASSDGEELAFATFAAGGAALAEAGAPGGAASAQGSAAGGLSWPAGIKYVANIPYDGAGRIVDTREDAEMGEYFIYIDGATLDSANAYIDKLYAAGFTKMHMFRDAGDHLDALTGDTLLTKLGFDSPDELSVVQVVLNTGATNENDVAYNLCITFADMEY